MNTLTHNQDVIIGQMADPIIIKPYPEFPPAALLTSPFRLELIDIGKIKRHSGVGHFLKNKRTRG